MLVGRAGAETLAEAGVGRMVAGVAWKRVDSVAHSLVEGDIGFVGVLLAFVDRRLGLLRVLLARLHCWRFLGQCDCILR